MVLKILKTRSHEETERDRRQLSLIRSMITANETQFRLRRIDQEEFDKVNAQIEAMIREIEERYE